LSFGSKSVRMCIYVHRIGSPQQRPESYPQREHVSRSHSVKSPAKTHRAFRASELIVCDVLGRGFYGQAVKVSHAIRVSRTCWKHRIWKKCADGK